MSPQDHADYEAEPYRWFPDGLPDALLDLDNHELLRALGKPTLIRIPGEEKQPPRGIATLLHGDESTGYEAITRIMRRRRTYPFDVYVIIGNVRAALDGPGFGHRYLDDQEDFNRVWGLDELTTQMRRGAREILDRLLAADIAAMVDVHNNTGDNPFYAIVTNEDAATLNLATLFTTTLLRWNLGVHTMMEALDEQCPAIAIECGLPGRPESHAFAVDGLRRFLGAEEIENDRCRRDYDMLGDLRKVTVRPEVRFAFGGELAADLDFVIEEDADVHNFVHVGEGHVLGRVHHGSSLPIMAVDAAGNDVSDEHFRVIDEVVVTTSPATPVMMTRTVEAARKDCLFYLTGVVPPPLL